MTEFKVIITAKEGKCSVGIGSPNCDPHLSTVEGGLEQALAKLPELIQQAQAKWSQSPRNHKSDIVPTPLLSPPARTPSPSSSATKTAQPKDQPSFF
jgi:hypothetical protein